jgi:hypothetical protein
MNAFFSARVFFGSPGFGVVGSVFFAPRAAGTMRYTYRTNRILKSACFLKRILLLSPCDLLGAV